MRYLLRVVMPALLTVAAALAIFSPGLLPRAVGVLILAACPLSCVALLVVASRAKARCRAEEACADQPGGITNQAGRLSVG
ncbi:MAG: hypothetical protein ACRDZ1_07980 [Acidimicrobiia bacterium]